MTKIVLGLLATASMFTATAASAQLTATSSPSGPPSGSAATTFDNRTLGNSTQATNTGITVSFTGGGAFVQGSSTGNYLAPYVVGTSGSIFGGTANPGGQPTGTDTTTYISTGVGSATLSFGNAQSYLGLLWGTIDTYEMLTFNLVGGGTATFTGSQALALGNSTNGSAYINITSATPFTSVVASSTINSFEFDNVALRAVAATPEPGTWAMMIVGFGLAGYALRRRQKVAARFTFA